MLNRKIPHVLARLNASCWKKTCNGKQSIDLHSREHSWLRCHPLPPRSRRWGWTLQFRCRPWSKCILYFFNGICFCGRSSVRKNTRIDCELWSEGQKIDLTSKQPKMSINAESWLDCLFFRPSPTCMWTWKASRSRSLSFFHIIRHFCFENILMEKDLPNSRNFRPSSVRQETCLFQS